MGNAVQSKVFSFNDYLAEQREAGLFITNGKASTLKAMCYLEELGFARSQCWRDIVSNLEKEKSTYIVLQAPLSKELYDLIAQYYKRAGMIQIMDRETLVLSTTHFDPNKSNLLLIAEGNTLNKIESNFMIRDKVGLVEIIDDGG
jgi:hypothetical protein